MAYVTESGDFLPLVCAVGKSQGNVGVPAYYESLAGPKLGLTEIFNFKD